MRVLITGGLGFVGLNLARDLLALKHECVILDVISTLPAEAGDLSGKLKTISGSILEIPFLIETVQEENVNCIVHLAALRNNASQDNPYSAFKLNVEGAMNIFEVARLTRVKRVVYASSVAVQGPPEYYEKLGFHIEDLTEEAPVRPFNVYGATKAFNEEMGKQYFLRYGLDSLGIRLGVIYGPGKKGGSRTSLFNDAIEESGRGNPVSISTMGDQPINLQYIKDAAYALLCACIAESPGHRVYNSGGVNIPVRSFVSEIRKIVPTAKITLIEETKRRPATSSLSWDLAKAELGYVPRYDLASGIRDHLESLDLLPKRAATV